MYAPHRAYAQTTNEPTRVDLILTLYDRALAALDKAELMRDAGNDVGARAQEAQVRLIVSALGSGIEHRDPLSLNFLRLYEFVSHTLSQGTPDGTQSARRVLLTLREGFETIRAEAVDLERRGVIPSLGGQQVVELLG